MVFGLRRPGGGDTGHAQIHHAARDDTYLHYTVRVVGRDLRVFPLQRTHQGQVGQAVMLTRITRETHQVHIFQQRAAE